MRLPGIYKHVAQVESCCTLDYQKFGRCLTILRLLSPYTADEHTLMILIAIQTTEKNLRAKISDKIHAVSTLGLI